jgi:hypothetical protein
MNKTDDSTALAIVREQFFFVAKSSEPPENANGNQQQEAIPWSNRR